MFHVKRVVTGVTPGRPGAETWRQVEQAGVNTEKAPPVFPESAFYLFVLLWSLGDSNS